MRPLFSFSLVILAACSAQTRVQVPSEVGDVDWSALSFATAMAYDAGMTSGGLQKHSIVLAISDRADLCDFTGPEGAVDTSIDIRMLQIGMETVEIELGKYVATTKSGPGTINGPSDVAMTGFVYHRLDGDTLIRAFTGTSPRASMEIEAFGEGLVPVAGSFSYRVEKDRGTAQPADFDANDDGQMDYRKIDALVEGTFVDAEWCKPSED